MSELDGVGIAARIEEMTRRIVDRFQPERIVLFGSHARGTAGPDSDIDLLVVVSGGGSKRRQVADIHRLLADLATAKDVVVVTPEDVERYRNTTGTIVKSALREGKVLYERAP